MVSRKYTLVYGKGPLSENLRLLGFSRHTLLVATEWPTTGNSLDLRSVFLEMVSHKYTLVYGKGPLSENLRLLGFSRHTLLVATEWPTTGNSRDLPVRKDTTINIG